MGHLGRDGLGVHPHWASARCQAVASTVRASQFGQFVPPPLVFGLEFGQSGRKAGEPVLNFSSMLVGGLATAIESTDLVGDRVMVLGQHRGRIEDPGLQR